MKAQALASGESRASTSSRTRTQSGRPTRRHSHSHRGERGRHRGQPHRADALNDAMARKLPTKGIVVVAVDSGVTDPDAYIISNDQKKYGYHGAKWLFDHLGGKGDVVYMGGIAGRRPTPTANGLQPGPRREPRHHCDQRDSPIGTSPLAPSRSPISLRRGLPFDGVWTSGIDNIVVDAFKTAGVPFEPIVGADGSEFVASAGQHQLPRISMVPGNQPRIRGWRGCRARPKDSWTARTADPITLSDTRLSGQRHATEGKAALAAAAPIHPVPDDLAVGTHDPRLDHVHHPQLLACKGPGE